MPSSQKAGTRRLANCAARGNDGPTLYLPGRDAVGYLIYTDVGFMSVAVVAAGRKSYAKEDRLGGTDAEWRAAAEGFFS